MSEQVVGQPVLLVESESPDSEIGFYVAASRVKDVIHFIDEQPEVRLLELALDDLAELRSDDPYQDPVVRFAKDFVERGWLSKGMERAIDTVQCWDNPLNLPDEFRALVELDGLGASFSNTLMSVSPLVRVCHLADYLDHLDISLATADGREGMIDLIPEPPVFAADTGIYQEQVSEIFEPNHPVVARARALGCWTVSWQYAIDWVDTARSRWPVVETFPSGGFAVHPVIYSGECDDARTSMREVQPGVIDISIVNAGEKVRDC